MRHLTVIGDSQSAPRAGAVGATQTWGCNVARRKGLGYVDKAVSGNTSADMLARVDDALGANGAGGLFGIMGGANDLYLDPAADYPPLPWTAPQPAAVGPARYAANICAIVARAQAAGRVPFVVTPWALWSTPSLNQGPFYLMALRTALAASFPDVPLVDAWTIQSDAAACMGQPPMWTYAEADWQHPNPMGHFLIYERVLAALD